MQYGLKRMEIGQVSEVQERFTIGDPLECGTVNVTVVADYSAL